MHRRIYTASQALRFERVEGCGKLLHTWFKLLQMIDEESLVTLSLRDDAHSC